MVRVRRGSDSGLDPRRTRLAIIAALALSLGGCGSPAPRPIERFYALDPAPLETPSGTSNPGTLQVGELAARGFLGGRQIVFRAESSPLEVLRHPQLLWEEPVPRAMTRNLVEGLRAAKVFRFTLVQADRGRADYRLGGEVLRFEHLPTAVTPRVSGTLELALVRAADRSVLSNNRYSREVEIQGTTPEAMVEAFNRLAALLVADVVRDLRIHAP